MTDDSGAAGVPSWRLVMFPCQPAKLHCLLPQRRSGVPPWPGLALSHGGGHRLPGEAAARSASAGGTLMPSITHDRPAAWLCRHRRRAIPLPASRNCMRSPPAGGAARPCRLGPAVAPGPGRTRLAVWDRAMPLRTPHATRSPSRAAPRLGRNNVGDRALAEHLIMSRDHRGGPDAGLCEQEVLDFPRVDLLVAAVDHVIGPAGPETARRLCFVSLAGPQPGWRSSPAA
jgi:hypothetical protein